MSSATSSFGAYVRRAREAKGLRMKDLAKELDCTVVYLSEIELSRKAPPSQEKISKIAEVLEIDSKFLQGLAAASKPRLELELESMPARYQQFAMALARSWNDLSEDQMKRIIQTLEEHE